MAHKIGPRGYVDLTTAKSGALRHIKVVEFTSRNGATDTGACYNPQFKEGQVVVGVVNMDEGQVVTGSFGAIYAGEITQVDTGGLGDAGAFEADSCVALVLGDTGAAG